MVFKATLLIQNGTGSAAGGPQAFSHLAGYSESVLYGGADITVLRQLLFQNGAWGTGLCQARAALLPPSAAIIGVRIGTAFPTTGRSQTQKISFPGGGVAPTDVPQVGIQCTIGAFGGINVRRFALRGVVDDTITYGELVPGAYGAKLAVYFASLGNFNFRGLALLEPFYDILNISAAGLMTTTAPTGYAIGAKVRISNAKDVATKVVFSAINRVLTIGPGANQVTLQDWIHADSIDGKVQRQFYNIYFMDPSTASVDRVVVRKVGRPFEQYHGRRSNRT